jgi:hypothetical protein
MPAACETAAFAGDDPGCLVEASLACSRCLSGSVAARLRLEDYDPRVECVCRRCGYARSVFLTTEQALRLSLHVAGPPDSLPRSP